MALLDALRALTSFSPPSTLPECDPALLGDVLEAHGLAPLASYQAETTRLGASLPTSLREKLLGHYQGVINDNVLKFVTLRGLLKLTGDLPVVLLEAAAYAEWLYPHMAFRPVGELRLAVRAVDGPRFGEAIRGVMSLVETGEGGRTAVFGDGKLTVRIQEGLWPGGPEDEPLFARRVPVRVFGPGAGRPSAEDALLATVGDQAQLGLYAPLITFVDLRELLLQPHDPADVLARARALRLDRALHGAARLASFYFPEVEEAAARLTPGLSLAERIAVDRIVESAKDPARLRHLRGSAAAARLIVAP